MKQYLRVKIKSLAAEASIIRHEERRAKTSRAYRREAKRRLRLGVETGPAAIPVGQKGEFRTLTNSEAELATKQAQPPSTEQLDLWHGLNSHRRNEVRHEARCAQLAYAFIRGRAYRQVEATRKMIAVNTGLRGSRQLKIVPTNPPNYVRVAQLVTKYGAPVSADEIKKWCAAKAESPSSEAA